MYVKGCFVACGGCIFQLALASEGLGHTPVEDRLVVLRGTDNNTSRVNIYVCQ